jgi:hypothetical protein
MPTAQVNGTPTTSSSTNNNSNTIKTIGVGYNVGVYGSKVVEGLVSEKSKSAGTFAHDHVLPLTFAVTDELAGVPTSVMSTNGYDHENIEILPEDSRSMLEKHQHRSEQVISIFIAVNSIPIQL